MTKPRKRRHARTKQAILDAAFDIVHEEGANALNIRSIAERIDYSPAGLYEYFAGKDEIIGALCEQGHAQLAAAMSHIDRALPVVDYMFGIGLAYTRFARENPDYFMLMFTAAPLAAGDHAAGEDPQQAVMAEGSSFNILVQAIRRGIAEGVFVEGPHYGWLEMAYAAWATVHGLAMLRATTLRDVSFDFETAERETLANFMRGLRAA